MTDTLPLSASVIPASPNATPFESMPPRVCQTLHPAPSSTHDHSLVNFDKLPTEIIARVFQEVQRCHRTVSGSKWWSQELSKDLDFGWLVVAHVCSLWRKIALDLSALWNCHLCFSMPMEIVASFVERSGILPLTLSFRDSATSLLNRRWLPTFVLYLVRAIDYRSCDATASAMKRVLTLNLPQLEELSIIEVHTKCLLPDAPGWRLSDRAPKLKRLTWLCHSPPMHSPLYSINLTHLALGMPVGFKKVTTYRSVSGFETLFHSVPNLKELSFYNLLPFDFNASSPTMVVLPASLRYLNIFATSLHWAKCKFHSPFWAHLQAAPPTILAVQYAYDSDKPSTLNGLVDHGVEMLSHITAGFSLGCPAWELDISSTIIGAVYEERPRPVWMHCWKTSGSPYGFVDSGDWPLALAPGGRYLRGPADAGILKMLDRLPLQSLRAISFAPDALQFWHGDGCWPGPFADARAVRRIAFSLWHCMSLLCALARSDADRPLLFPVLETIAIMPMHEGGDSRAFDEPELHSALLDAVRARGQRGAPIREVLVTQGLQFELRRLWSMLQEDGVEVEFF